MKKIAILLATTLSATLLMAQNTPNQLNTFGYTFYQPNLHVIAAVNNNSSIAQNKSVFNALGVYSNISYGFNNGTTVYGNILAGRSFSTNSATAQLSGMPVPTTLANPVINCSEESIGVQKTWNENLKTGLSLGYINLENAPNISGVLTTPLAPLPAGTPLTISCKAVGFELNPYMEYQQGKSLYAISADYKNMWFKTSGTMYTPIGAISDTSAPSDHAILSSISPQYSYQLTPETQVGVQSSLQVVNENFRSLATMYSQATTNNNLFFMENSLDMISIKPGITYTPAALKGALHLSLFGGVDSFNFRKCNQVMSGNSPETMPYETYLLLTPQINLTLPIGENFFFNTLIQMDVYNAINGTNSLNYNEYYTFDKALHFDSNIALTLGYYF